MKNFKSQANKFDIACWGYIILATLTPHFAIYSICSIVCGALSYYIDKKESQ